MRIRRMAHAFLSVIVVLCAACGGDSGNPVSPSGSSSGSSGGSSGGTSGGTGSPATVGRGTITAQIDGVTFTGVAAVATNQSGIFSTAASNSSGTTLGFAALAATGTTPIGATSPTNASLLVVSGGTAQSWGASTAGGSGTLTITSITSTGASGTFSFTMVPVPGSGASGTKSVTNGTFSVTF